MDYIKRNNNLLRLSEISLFPFIALIKNEINFLASEMNEREIWGQILTIFYSRILCYLYFENDRDTRRKYSR